MKNIKFLILLVFILPIVLFSKEDKTIESQPQILFKHKDLTKAQDKRELLLKFNTAVLYLEQDKYKHAIKLFKQSSKLLKVPSYLNIGIAYYKLNSHNNAYLYLKKLYDFKELKFNDKFSYFSAAYYLYKITNNEKYIQEIAKVSANSKHLTESEMLLVVDTLILQKRYKKALVWAKKIKNISQLKVAMLCIKLRDYDKAKYYLTKAQADAKGDEAKNEVLWLKLFRDLKANDITNVIDVVLKLQDRKKIFYTHKKLPLELFFNKKKFTPKQYQKKIQHPSYDTQLDFAYYFAPFIFEDYNSMGTKETQGFILKDKASIPELNTMIKYNADFLEVIKEDPIKRVQLLQEMIDKNYDTQAYEYYNLALCYAQIYDYNNAYKYFKKAYSLDHGNKLYSVMTYLTTKKFNVKLDKVYKEFLIKNILSNKGDYQYLGKYLYKVFEEPSMKIDKNLLTSKQKKSIFFRALYFIENIKKFGIREEEPLLVEFKKDPLVYLFTLIAKEKGENQYLYISRIQDQLPKIFNNRLIKGSLIITDFYIDTLRALGLFNRTDFNIDNEKSPTYLRTKAIIQLYLGKPKKSIKLVEQLQMKYDLQSIDSYYILVAGYLDSGQKELAYATLSELELIYKDKDAKFLIGVKMIQDKKLNSATQFFRERLKGKLVDFRLNNFDNFLESL
jgi:hypothetical protein